MTIFFVTVLGWFDIYSLMEIKEPGKTFVAIISNESCSMAIMQRWNLSAVQFDKPFLFALKTGDVCMCSPAGYSSFITSPPDISSG